MRSGGALVVSMDQVLLASILVMTIAAFLWGKWRHDIVALGSLLACTAVGLVPAADAFTGFGHPAVITVACVLVLSRALQVSGAVDVLARRLVPESAGTMVTIAALTGLAAVLSAFMNNVGALALLMPVAIQVASRRDLPAGKLLMPLAFGSILGGMTTLIGTPPNLIVAGFRGARAGEGFAMFDFTPVGLAVAAAGVAFISLVGWRLVPSRERSDTEGFKTEAYLTEVRIPDSASVADKTLREVETLLEAAGAQVVGLIRNDVRLATPARNLRVRSGDILVMESEPEILASVLSELGLQLEESDQAKEAEGETEKDAGRESGDDGPADETTLAEFAVLPNSSFVGRSATLVRLRTRFGINLLAVSRKGRRSVVRLRTMGIRAGDVLLLQGAPESLAEFAGQFGCVPLAERSLYLPDKKQALLATGIMVAAVGGAALGLLPAAACFAVAVLAAVVLGAVSARTVYDAIDWSVIVLLGALIPVAGALSTTGAADLIAGLIVGSLPVGQGVLALTAILVVTTLLSAVVNNAATAAVMCPIAIGTANQLGASADPFLMAVAVGASCAFLTPIAHQNNTLILGPGGFRFGDYWQLGLPLEILVVTVGVPAILFVWPL